MTPWIPSLSSGEKISSSSEEDSSSLTNPSDISLLLNETSLVISFPCGSFSTGEDKTFKFISLSNYFNLRTIHPPQVNW